MDELTDLIVNQLGEKIIVGFPDMFARGWSFPLDETLIDEVRNTASRKIFDEVIQLGGQLLELRNPYGREHGLSYSTRIFGHDLRGLLGGASMPTHKLLSEGCDAENFLKRVTPVRALCLTMAYVASGGNTKFTSLIPVEQIQHLFLGDDYDFEFVGREGDSNSILTPDYVSFLQIVKNAPETPKVTYKIEGDYSVVTIADSGEGIRDGDGTPLPPESLKDIFGMFTTNTGGGFGLQLVRKILELREGYLTVETTTEGNPTFSYSTQTDLVTEVHPKERGTTFDLYVPRV